MQKEYPTNHTKGAKIVLVDSDFSFRISLKQFLTQELASELTAEVANEEELFSNHIISFSEIIIINLTSSPSKGFRIAQKINWMNPQAKLIAIAENSSVQLRTLIENGFKGCVLEQYVYNTISDAISRVSDNQYYFPHELDN